MVKATEMEGRTAEGKFAKGYKPPTTFADRPQDRHNGSWHKENTPRYKMETIMAMSDEELDKARTEGKTSFEKAFANVLYLARTAENVQEAESCMRILDRMVNQVYGQMPQVQITAEADEKTADGANKFIRGFALP